MLRSSIPHCRSIVVSDFREMWSHLFAFALNSFSFISLVKLLDSLIFHFKCSRINEVDSVSIQLRLTFREQSQPFCHRAEVTQRELSTVFVLNQTQQCSCFDSNHPILVINLETEKKENPTERIKKISSLSIQSFDLVQPAPHHSKHTGISFTAPFS